MDAIFQMFGFFASSIGLITAGVMAALVVVLWDWRAAMTALMVVQTAVASVCVLVYGMPVEWGLIQIAVMALACGILILSAVRGRPSPSQFEAGTWMLRTLILILIWVCWRSISLSPKLPVVGSQVVELFVWLAFCAVIMLGLGDSPLFTATGLLLWCIPAMAMVSIVLAIPALVAIIGILELLVALVCSYLILVEQIPIAEAKPVMTDITFPDYDPTLLRGSEPRMTPFPEPETESVRPLPTMPRRSAVEPRRAASKQQATNASGVPHPLMARRRQ